MKDINNIETLNSLESITIFENNDMIFIEKANAPAGRYINHARYIDLYLSIGVSLNVVKKFFTIVGNDTDTDFIITHGLDQADSAVTVQVFKQFGDNKFVTVPIENTDKDTVTVKFGIAPLTGENYGVVVI